MTRELAIEIKTHLELALAQLLQTVFLTPTDDPHHNRMFTDYRNVHDTYGLFCEANGLTTIGITTG